MVPLLKGKPLFEGAPLKVSPLLKGQPPHPLSLPQPLLKGPRPVLHPRTSASVIPASRAALRWAELLGVGGEGRGGASGGGAWSGLDQ